MVGSCSFGLKSCRLLVVVLKKHGERLLELEFVNTLLVGVVCFLLMNYQPVCMYTCYDGKKCSNLVCLGVL